MIRTIGTLAFAVALVAGVGAASATPYDTGPDQVWDNVFEPIS